MCNTLTIYEVFSFYGVFFDVIDIASIHFDMNINNNDNK